MEPLGGEGEGREQGVGSLSPTRDECGWTFALRSPKRGFPSKKKRVDHYARERKAGKGESMGKDWLTEQYS